MEFDGRFSQRACNAWLKSHQQMALSTYYINKANLSRQCRDEQIADLANKWKERNPTKYQSKMTLLMLKYSGIIEGYNKQSEYHLSQAKHMVAILEKPLDNTDNQHQTVESPLPEPNVNPLDYVV